MKYTVAIETSKGWIKKDHVSNLIETLMYYDAVLRMENVTIKNIVVKEQPAKAQLSLI